MELHKNWWKFLGGLLVLYSIIFGFLGDAPNLGILQHTIRNLYFHVPMWFAMIALLLVSAIYSILNLIHGKQKHHIWSKHLASTAVLFGIIGLITGSVWAKYTWGYYWVKEDPKLNGAAMAVLIYTAHYILVQSIEDKDKEARISSVFNVFAFPIFIALIIVYPRMQDVSLHPDAGETTAFSQYDLNNAMRLVFYPAVIGWIIIAAWITQLKVKLTNHEENRLNPS